MILSSQALGAVAELEFAKQAILKGYPVSKPLDGCQPGYDFIVEMPEGLRKVQVKKTCHVEYKGAKRMQVRTTHGGWKPYEEGAYDYLAAVSFEANRIWLIPHSDASAVTGLTKSDRKISDWDKYLF